MATKKDATTTETFMTLLERQRIARGLTQAELAQKLDKSPSTISLWESGVTKPHPKAMKKLARLLGVDTMTLTKLIEPELATQSVATK